MIYVDAEFFNTKEEHVTPVCAVAYNSNTGEVIKFWAFEEPRTQELFREYCEKNKDEVWCSFAVTAEARYFLAHGIDPVKFRWVDLFIEYKQISNHNDRIAYGMQLVNGSPKMTRRPPAKWQRTEEDSGSSYRQTHSLAEATYKLCGIVRDTEEKDLMRDIIISGDRDKILENKKRILDYCYEDTIYLEEIEKAIKKEFEELLDFNELMSLKEEMYLRGKYSALTGRMESFGYPINYEQAKNFSDSVKAILNDCQSEINELFPEVKPFRWNAKTFSYTWNQGVTKDWIRNNVPDVSRWMTTDSGDISLSLEAWTRFFDFKHDYPKDNFGAQMVRYLKLKQNLNGFSPNNKGEKRTFWDSVGSDHRVRPYMNHYGAQSSRSQPAATGFLFLKPAWMRSLCQPKKGKAIGGFDYGSQEFLISALVSKDENMLWAYESGDIYLEFAKLAGAVPRDGKREDYEAKRNLFKATCLLKGSLIRVRDQGFKKIEDIVKGDLIWDGSDWRECHGAIKMPEKTTMLWQGINVTEDHLIKTNDGWEEVGKYSGIPENSQNTHSRNWKEVWPLVCSLSILIYKRILGEILYFGGRWVRKEVCGKK